MTFLRNLETTDTQLAAALTAVGIPLDKTTPVRVLTGDRGDRIAWFFQEQSPCGQYVTKHLMLAWQDPAWHERNPEHPFAYLKVAFQNAELLTDYAKRRVPIAAVAKGSKIAFLTLNASPDLQRKVFTELKR